MMIRPNEALYHKMKYVKRRMEETSACDNMKEFGTFWNYMELRTISQLNYFL